MEINITVTLLYLFQIGIPESSDIDQVTKHERNLISK